MNMRTLDVDLAIVGLVGAIELAQEQFHVGIILYDGDHTTYHEEGIFSVPFTTLYE